MDQVVQGLSGQLIELLAGVAGIMILALLRRLVLVFEKRLGLDMDVGDQAKLDAAAQAAAGVAQRLIEQGLLRAGQIHVGNPQVVMLSQVAEQFAGDAMKKLNVTPYALAHLVVSKISAATAEPPPLDALVPLMPPGAPAAQIPPSPPLAV